VSLTFLSPIVWLGALAVLLPIAIHLLSRATRTPVRFPTIRFLEVTRLSATARHRIQDWPLLAVRTAIVLIAVAALAGPILVTPAREAAWEARVARAVILDDRSASPDDELRSASAGRTFARQRLRDAVSDAVRWLERQRPNRREIVVLSAFRRGGTDASDFSAVPDQIGIRMVRTSEGNAVRAREISRLVWRDGRAVRVLEQMTLRPEATELREIDAEPLAELPVRVTASPGEQPLADAALRAVLRRGLRLPPAGLLEPITVAWPGDVEGLAAVLEARLAAPMEQWEPETLSEAELAAIAREPAAEGPPTPVDLGDRRTLWAVVLVLLMTETWLRRGAAWT
jgi:hypothetical protein